jgi:hypothetical protein
MAPGHVPAWKRLGLKLKNAPGESTASQTSVGVVSTTIPTVQGEKKRKEPPSSSGGSKVSNQTPKKKIKFDQEDSSGTLQGDDSPVTTAKQTQTPTPKKKRKSVSFSNDTKDEDGGKDAEDLLDGATLSSAPQASPKATGQAREELAQNTPLDAAELAHVNESKKKKKKKSKSTTEPQTKFKSSSPTTEDPNHIPAYLEYLTMHHTNRSKWKFNKAKQSQIIKKSLDIEKIPTSYDEALREYFMALEGQRAAQRLHSESERVIKEDDKVLEVERASDTALKETQAPKDAEKKKKKLVSSPAEENKTEKDTAREAYMREMYEQALVRAKKQIHEGELAREESELIEDPTWRKRFFRRKRAELLFWATDKKFSTEEFQPKPGKIEYEEKVRNTSNVGVPNNMNAGRQAMIDANTYTNPSLPISPAPARPAQVRPLPVKSAPVKIVDSTQAKRKRKRKRRSDMPDDDTSSDESSSSSSGSDSEDSDKGLNVAEKKLAQAFGVAAPAAKATSTTKKPSSKEENKQPDETSVSGSSSSDDTSSEENSDSSDD